MCRAWASRATAPPTRWTLAMAWDSVRPPGFIASAKRLWPPLALWKGPLRSSMAGHSTVRWKMPAACARQKGQKGTSLRKFESGVRSGRAPVTRAVHQILCRCHLDGGQYTHLSFAFQGVRAGLIVLYGRMASVSTPCNWACSHVASRALTCGRTCCLL